MSECDVINLPINIHIYHNNSRWIRYIKEASDAFKRADKVAEEKPALSETISEQKSQLHGIHRLAYKYILMVAYWSFKS